MIPYSLAFFALLAGTTLLQLVPLVNILMLVTASMWPTVLGNAGLIGIALEATLGRLARAWLIVPALAYGGYYAIVIPEHYAAARLQDDRAADAAAVRLSFDPARTALIVGGTVRSDMLLRNYGLPVVYATDSDGPERFRSARYLGKDICAAVAARLPDDTPWTQLQWLDADGKALSVTEGAAGCILEMPEAAPEPRLEAIMLPGPSEVAEVDNARLDVAVTAPDGTRARLRGGIVRPLPWVPAAIIWCGPSLTDDENTDSAKRPVCSGRLLREGELRGGPFQKAEIEQTQRLASALSLSSTRPARQTNARIAAMILARVDDYVGRRRSAELARLDAMIAAPEEHLKPDDDRLLWLRAYPEQLSARADGLMRLLETDIRKGDPTIHRDHLAAEFVAALPDRDIARLGPRLLALYASPAVAREPDHWLWGFDQLVARLGDLGPSALPVLTSENMRDGHVRALCRIGTPAREAAGPLFERMWARDSAGLPLFELAVATRRIGLPVGSVSAFRQKKDGHFLTEAVRVTPTSPTSVCDLAIRRKADAEIASYAAKQAEFWQRHHPIE